jgi:hypothetical protein
MVRRANDGRPVRDWGSGGRLRRRARRGGGRALGVFRGRAGISLGGGRALRVSRGWASLRCMSGRPVRCMPGWSLRSLPGRGVVCLRRRAVPTFPVRGGIRLRRRALRNTCGRAGIYLPRRALPSMSRRDVLCLCRRAVRQRHGRARIGVAGPRVLGGCALRRPRTLRPPGALARRRRALGRCRGRLRCGLLRPPWRCRQGLRPGLGRLALASVVRCARCRRGRRRRGACWTHRDRARGGEQQSCGRQQTHPPAAGPPRASQTPRANGINNAHFTTPGLVN